MVNPLFLRSSRLWSRVLILLGAIVLTACGNGSNSSTDPTTTSTPSHSPDTTTSTSPEGQAPNQSNTWTISSQGLGPVQLGMSLKDLRDSLGNTYQIDPTDQMLVDWDALAVSQQGVSLFYILRPQGQPLTDEDGVDLILVESPQYKTPEGIGPGSTIAEAVAVYGAATLAYNVDDESREYVRFANAPNNLSFRTSGSSGNFVGRYGESLDASYYETQDYQADGTIAFILIDGFAAQDGETQSNSSSTHSATLDCSDPVTTLEINGCAKQAYEQVDQDLNQVYQQVRDRLDKPDADNLGATEQAWLNFRDAHCNAYSQSFVGGSAYPTFLFGCLTSTTEQRLGHLRQELGLFPPAETPSYGLGNVTVDGQTLDCDNPQAAPVIKYCAQLAYEAKDRELNQVYSALIDRLGSENQTNLVDAQLAWLEYRDRHCDFTIRDIQGTTGYETYRNDCLRELTNDRLEQLQEQLDR